MMTMSELMKAIFTNHPSSAQVALTYASNLHRPLRSRLTPLRLTYYALLLVLVVRFCLFSAFREAYYQHDLTMRLINSTVKHHMVGLVVAPFLLCAIAFDYVYCVRASGKVAPMLIDILVVNQSKIKNQF